jgi:hypothetical protein
MGVVYRAYDDALQRTVAVKRLLPDLAADEGARARFVHEAQAAARVQHDHIVGVYAVVQPAEGVPYLVMEYVAGQTLAEIIRSHRQVPAQEAAQLIAQAAVGLSAAHAAGLVHRDIKPSNIILDPFTGRAKIMDFGLARLTERPSGLTEPGALAGTPSYMSPEQVGGLELDGRTDVYSLGVTLYEALTGETPFRGALHMVLRQIAAEEPRAPRQLNDTVPRDLETICLKAMAKEPARRYASAAALADDLRRWHRGEPIQARPAGGAEKVWRWCRRKPREAGLIGAVCILLLVAIVVPWILALHLQSALAASDRDRLAKEAALTYSYTASGLMASDQGNTAQAVSWFTNAARLAENDRARRALNRLRARTWSRESWTPVRALPPAGLSLVSLSFHPGGAYALLRAKGSQYTIWDIDKEKLLSLPGDPAEVRAAIWSPVGDLLALAVPGRGVDIVRFPECAVLQNLPFPGAVRALGFSADGRFLAIASDRLRVWCCSRREWLIGEAVHPKQVMAVVFAPQGGLLATGCDDEKARVFAWSESSLSTQPLFPPVPHYTERYGPNNIYPDHFTPPVFVRDGRELLTAWVTEWKWWDASTGKLLNTPQPGDSCLVFLDPSPDGKHLAMGSYGPTRVFDVSQRRLLPGGTLLGQLATGSAFSPDRQHGSLGALLVDPGRPVPGRSLQRRRSLAGGICAGRPVRGDGIIQRAGPSVGRSGG